MAYVMGRNVGDFELIAKWYPLTHSKPQHVDFGSCSNFQLKTLSVHCERDLGVTVQRYAAVHFLQLVCANAETAFSTCLANMSTITEHRNRGLSE